MINCSFYCSSMQFTLAAKIALIFSFTKAKALMVTVSSHGSGQYLFSNSFIWCIRSPFLFFENNPAFPNFEKGYAKNVPNLNNIIWEQLVTIPPGLFGFAHFKVFEEEIWKEKHSQFHSRAWNVLMFNIRTELKHENTWNIEVRILCSLDFISWNAAVLVFAEHTKTLLSLS